MKNDTGVLRPVNNKKDLIITPDFIPHTKFHKGAWLLAASDPYWYYFREKRNSNRIANRNFLQSVDAPLRDLVMFLHRRRIKTTPSCAGHHFSEKNFEQIYTHLEKDEKEIQNGGLELVDIETGKPYLYKNKNYNLPWSREHFVREAASYQQKGIMGIRTANRKKLAEQMLNLKIPGVRISEADSIIFIYVNGETNGENSKTWKMVTDEIKELF